MASLLRDGADLAAGLASGNGPSATAAAVLSTMAASAAGMAASAAASASAGGDAHFFDDASSPAKIKSFLDSHVESDKLHGMKWLLAMLSKGNSVAEFFPDVVKNVVVKNLEVKKMVYIYLVHYADFNDACREIALLSINSFQKDLAGANQLIRGLALRVLTSIRVPDIIQIQLLAVRKCATDSSPYVRRCAAVALAKLHVLDPSQDDALVELVEKLLADSSTLVLGSAVAALQEIAPSNYELLHGSFRKLCHLLADLDEWTQVSVLNMMQRYVRSQFTDPHRRGGSSSSRSKIASHVSDSLSISSSATNVVSANASKTVKKPNKGMQKGFYSDDDDSDSSEDGGPIHSSAVSKPTLASALVPQQGSVFMGKDIVIEYDSMLDADHRLILSSSLALLKSRNSAVVLAVCALHFHCGVMDAQSPTPSRIAKAMVRIMKSRREIQYSVLANIKLMALEAPWMFQPFVQDFFVKSTDPLFNRLLKLDILTAICDKENSTSILKELQAYIKDNNNTFILASINAVAKVLEVNQDNLGHGVSGLLDVLICHSDGSVHAACATALRHLLQLGLVNSQAAAQAAAALVSQAEALDGGRRRDSDKKSSRKHSKRSAEREPDENAEEASRMRQLYKSYVSIMQQAVRRVFVADNKITNPVARANLIWLAGEYYSEFLEIAKDLLRLLAQSFCDEATTVKVQILNLAVKYSIHCVGDEEMESLMTYVLELSRYDVSIEVRDLARLMTAVCGLAAGEEEGSGQQQPKVDAEALEDLAGRAAKILLATKLPPAFVQNSTYSISASAAWEADGSDTKTLFLMGSVSAMTGYTSPGYVVLPPWSDKQPDSSVRDQGAAAVAAQVGGADGKGGDTVFTNKFTPAMSALDVASFYDDDDKEEKKKAAKRQASKGSKRRGSSSSSSSSSSRSTSESSSSESSSDSESSSGSSSSSSSDSDSSSSASSSDSSSDSDSSRDSRSGRHRRGAQPGHVAPVTAMMMTASDLAAVDAGAVQKRGIVQRVVRNRPQPSSGAASGGSLLDLPSNAEPSSQHLSSHSPMGMDLLDMGGSAGGGRGGDLLDPMPTHYTAYGASPMQHQSPEAPRVVAASSTPSPHLPPASDNALLAQILESFPNAAALSNDSSSPAPVARGSMPAMTAQQQPVVPVVAPSRAPSHEAVVVGEVLGAARQILNPDLCSGLSVTLAFRHGSSSASSSSSPRAVLAAGGKSVVMRVENRGRDYPIRRIRVGFPSDLRRSALEDVPLLGPGQGVTLTAELGLVDYVGKSVRMDIRSDGGSHSGSFPVETWDVIAPQRVPVTTGAGGSVVAEFDAWTRRLKGFSECIAAGCKVRPQPSSSSSSAAAARGGYKGIEGEELEGEGLVASIIERVLRVADLAVVHCDTEAGQVKFCGTTRHKPNTSHYIFVTIAKESRSNTVSVQVNCEDAVLTTALADLIKKSLAK